LWKKVRKGKEKVRTRTHRRERVANALEEFLNRSRVADEGDGLRGKVEGKSSLVRGREKERERKRGKRTILVSLGATSQHAVCTFDGIHSTKWSGFLTCRRRGRRTLEAKIGRERGRKRRQKWDEGERTWTACIWSSTSLIDTFPLNNAATVRYFPFLGSAAHIMFPALKICCDSSATLTAR
jgi:hypothetical protein